MASESVTDHIIERLFQNHSKQEIQLLSQKIEEFNSIQFTIDSITYAAPSFALLLDQTMPNLDEGFRFKMISNF